MSLEIDVLRALLRLARRRTNPTLDQLVVRVGVEEPEVRRTLFALARGGLVQRTPAGLRLSLLGLAVAVASAQRPRSAPAASAERILKTRLEAVDASAERPLPLARSARTSRRTRRAA